MATDVHEKSKVNLDQHFQQQLHMDNKDQQFQQKLHLDNKSKVIIIGAGIAGISAAEVLSKNGFNDFKVLEAADRVGGRIWTYDIEGTDLKVEMGANWIHGIERNPIYKIADENGLLQLRYKDKGLRHKNIFVTETGEEVNGKVVKECDFTYGLLIQECEEFYQMHMEPPNESVGEYMRDAIADKLENFSGNERRLRDMIFKQHLMQEAVVSGCNDLDDVSLSEFGCYEELPGVHYTIPPGFQSVLEILCSKVAQENIFLNHKVSSIKYGEEGTGDEEYNVCVECENGEKFYASHVIVTMSLGVLKDGCERIFKPKLPSDKQEAIQKLGFGVVDKINLYFDEPIVEPDVFRIELLWDDEEFSDDHQRCQGVENTWFRKIYSFEVVHENLITGWLCGDEAKHMETLSEEEIGKQCCNVLKKFLKKDIPLPTKVIRTQWGKDKNNLGSYCYIHLNAGITDVETIAEPLTDSSGKPVIQFAGEATHPSFYSTTHGALITGHREAKRIMDLYDLPYCQ